MNESAAPAIVTRGLSKRFAARTALHEVNLEVAPGESVALYGPNGAGKTTLLKLLTLGLRPTSGSFEVAGLTPGRQDQAIRRLVGLISHESFLYDDLTARQNLEFFAGMYGVEDPSGRAGQLLDEVGLTRRADDPVRTFSRGMRQRVSLARALVHDPQVVFLDEPFAGLDPAAARMLCGWLGRLRDEARTVVLVTHDVSRGLELCDRWILLSRGRIADGGSCAGITPAQLEGRLVDGATAPGLVAPGSPP